MSFAGNSGVNAATATVVGPGSWDRIMVVVLALTGTAMIVFLLSTGSITPAAQRFDEMFNKRVERAAGLPIMSPLVVTVYERVGAQSLNDNLITTEIVNGDSGGGGGGGGGGTGRNLVDLEYNERLVVVKPHNWFVYTNNGINFYYVTNNVSNRTANCNLDRQLIAIDFRLLTLAEPEDAKNYSGQLQVACINYTYDNLIRLFGVNANRTYLDLSGYFDKRKNPKAPDLVVEEVINYLLDRGLV